VAVSTQWGECFPEESPDFVNKLDKVIDLVRDAISDFDAQPEPEVSGGKHDPHATGDAVSHMPSKERRKGWEWREAIEALNALRKIASWRLMPSHIHDSGPEYTSICAICVAHEAMKAFDAKEGKPCGN
jgi:hypothetical protein